MNQRRDRVLFWYLIAIQAVCAQIILWTGLPVYRRLLHGESGSATTGQFALAITTVVLMQAGHWVSLQMKPRLQFPRRVVLGHVLIFVGELSLFFVSALAVVAVFDRGFTDFAVWKLCILAAMLFSMCSYKYQVTELGKQLIESESEKTPARIRRFIA
jgi:hypothetical protein